MPIFNRNANYPDRAPNYWLDYHVEGKRYREPGLGKNRVASQRLLAKRMSEIAAGTWRSPEERAGEAMTVAQWSERWVATRFADAELATARRAQQNVHDQAKRLERYVLPMLGERPIASIKRDDIKAVINELQREGRLAPRTMHHVYDAMRGMFTAAATAEPPLIDRNPCTLSSKKSGELPKKRDKDSQWRKQAVFTHGELIDLFTNPIVPPDRRMYYALLFFCGIRFGEGAGRKWSDYDEHAQPLGRIVIDSQYDGEALKGDGESREAPVHPFLEWMLKRWREHDFAFIMGRDPKPTDWIVPSREWKHRSLKHMERRLGEDLERLDQRKRTPHDLRASFITLAQDDGGERPVLERVTHKGNTDVWSGYSRRGWAVLCEHVGRLRFPIPGSEAPPHFQSHAQETTTEMPIFIERERRDGRDLNPPSSSGNRRKLEDLGSRVAREISGFLGIPIDGKQTVTPGVALDFDIELDGIADRVLAGSLLTAGQRRLIAGLLRAAKLVEHVEPGARKVAS